jgi:Mg-chelatase subunit ChlD
MNHPARYALLTLLCASLILTACTGAPATISQADVQATVEAGVRATLAAQPTQALAPTSLPSPTAAPPTATTAPTSPPVAPTVAPFTPATPTATGADAPTTAPESSFAPTDTTTVFRPAEGEAARIITNIQLVFDSSGSMAQRIGNETKIQAAQRAMERIINTLPDNPDLNVGFRVFGHEGDSSEAQKARSCQSTALLVPVQGVNKELLRQQARAWKPTGWTPISLALQKAGEDLQPGENVRNVIIMVTDGEETCGGDPCAVAKALAESQAEVRIDVVGFGLTPDVAKTLRCIAENSGGVYTDAQNGDALAQTLEELLAATIKRSTLRLVPVGRDGKPEEISLTSFTNAQGEDVLKTAQLPWMARFAREHTVELPPGEYRFTIAYVEIGGDQVAQHVTTTYTAIIEEGRETVAVIGRGRVTFVNDTPQSLRASDLRVDKAVNGQWEESIYPGQLVGVGSYFAFDRAFRLTPGRYRVYDRNRKAVLIDNLIVEPGKEITVRLRGE